MISFAENSQMHPTELKRKQTWNDVWVTTMATRKKPYYLLNNNILCKNILNLIFARRNPWFRLIWKCHKEKKRKNERKTDVCKISFVRKDFKIFLFGSAIYRFFLCFWRNCLFSSILFINVAKCIGKRFFFITQFIA